MVRYTEISIVSVMIVSFILFLATLYSSTSPMRVSLKNSEYGGNHIKEDSTKDKLLGGLLLEGFDEKSCLSRYQSVHYRKESPYKPSSYLLQKLRNHENLHRKCGSHTESFRKAVEQLKSGNITEITECKYVVWIANCGLGNRIITLVSTFLYAILTDRILIIERIGMEDLLCEPFLGSSWLVPEDFPLGKYSPFHRENPWSYGTFVYNHDNNNRSNLMYSAPLPSVMYLHLTHDYDVYDQTFFCEEDQKLLKKIPWLILMSNNYFLPSFFMIPSFREDLNKLFPDENTIFHHLGRYLLHPTNDVWGLITRSYEAYLANADEKIGLQIRILDVDNVPVKPLLKQVISCAMNQKLLPKINATVHSSISLNKNKKKITVLITSLSTFFYENIKKMYYQHPTVNGEIISLYQPTHEEKQKTEDGTHNLKAWAEMYLLSLTDKLIISGKSTFGYVAQGLGNLKPWILLKPKGDEIPDPACIRALSIELCFHAAPSEYCREKNRGNSMLVPPLSPCEDVKGGIKLVDPNKY